MAVLHLWRWRAFPHENKIRWMNRNELLRKKFFKKSLDRLFQKQIEDLCGKSK
jgi:hypothetical protein